MIAMPAGSHWTVLASGKETEGRFAVMEARALRGADPPRHLHTREDEFIYVLDGRVTLMRDGARFDGPAGTWLFLPRGSEHAIVAESACARLLVIVVPAGLEEALAEEPVDQDIERLVATAARYGVAITGPAAYPDATGVSAGTR